MLQGVVIRSAVRVRCLVRSQIKRVIIKYGALNSLVSQHNSTENIFLPQSVDPTQAVKYNLVPRLLLLTLPSPPRSIQAPSFLV